MSGKSKDRIKIQSKLDVALAEYEVAASAHRFIVVENDIETALEFLKQTFEEADSKIKKLNAKIDKLSK